MDAEGSESPEGTESSRSGARKLLSGAKRVLGIDPGTRRTAFCILGAQQKIVRIGLDLNTELLCAFPELVQQYQPDLAVFEMIGHYGSGMNAGATVFETCVWIGRFIEACGLPYLLLPRPSVKAVLVGRSSADDAAVRQQLLRTYGMPGTKKEPGPTYGIKADMWAALAVSHVSLSLASLHTLRTMTGAETQAAEHAFTQFGVLEADLSTGETEVLLDARRERREKNKAKRERKAAKAVVMLPQLGASDGEAHSIS